MVYEKRTLFELHRYTGSIIKFWKCKYMYMSISNIWLKLPVVVNDIFINELKQGSIYNYVAYYHDFIHGTSNLNCTLAHIKLLNMRQI